MGGLGFGQGYCGQYSTGGSAAAPLELPAASAARTWRLPRRRTTWLLRLRKTIWRVA